MKSFLHRFTFSVLVFVITMNLGIHYISINSYVRSVLIDYLIPTIWFQDILLILLLIFWFFDGGIKEIMSSKMYRFFIIFASVLLPSLSLAQRTDPAIYFYLRLILYFFFVIYIYCNLNPKRDIYKIINLLSVSVILLGVLSLAQWINQGSVFNNYLFFGEQPYNSSTLNIARTDFFGNLKIPVYGTFRHPNVFAGYLSFSLFLIFAAMYLEKKNPLYKISFILGFLSLILTFSQIAILSLLLAITFLVAIKKLGKRGVLLSMAGTFFLFVFGLVLPFLSRYEFAQTDPTYFRRINLLKSGYMMLENSPVFGIGLNNYTVLLPKYLPLTQILIFNQPVHNIFVLIGVEAGIVSLIAVLYLLFYCLKSLLEYGYGLAAAYFVLLLQIFIVGSFDHYLFTIHQTQYLFWLTVGLALAYTRVDAKVQD